ncbi:helix-turn-helix transcriptional regulator [Vibrio hannami]|uniref:helix-turn-helix domain-containing protein n=1 Tax=Vibrio hannami TaxID=2717094 RepID=UPI00240F3925|nr:helix-turn-helix transcriptional regulator [Vibrio hannami]MDG3085845.1 helix-turn-helix transcriptional regulator [Vibrio hannami]
MQVPQVDFNNRKNEQAQFEIVDLEELARRAPSLPHSPDQAHRVSFFAVLYVAEGCGSHMIDFIDYPFESGSVLFIQREQVHAYDFSGKPKGKVLLFTQAFLDQLHSNMRLPNYTPTHLDFQYQPVINLTRDVQQCVSNLLSELLRETSRVDNDPLIIMYLFSALSLTLHRERPESRQDKMSKEQNQRFARFFALLQTHYTSIRDANWYANQAHTTYKTLNQDCKLATNLTAKQLIDAYTTLEIKRRLVLRDNSVQQMAYGMGFDDASNFVKYFKKQTGSTPTQFQKKYFDPYL